MNKQPFIICSYYTLETPYQDISHKYLIPSIEKLQLKSDVRGIENKGSWQLNTSYKPQFIKEMLEKHNENIVWIDVDAEVLSYPYLFEEIPEEYNFAAHMLNRNDWYNIKLEPHDERELLTGTLFIRNNQNAKTIINIWTEECKQNKAWEQKVLQKIFEQYNIKICELPIGYSYIKTLPDGSKPNIQCPSPVIIHNQVSRLLKNKIR